MSEKVTIISLGCDKNRIDAEILAKRIANGGFELTGDPTRADCAVVNTCGFIESAKAEAIENIFDMLRLKEGKEPLRAVVVTGCLAERYERELMREIPELDAVLGLRGNADICEVISRALSGEKTEIFGEPEQLSICGDRLLSTPKHYAYLKIAEGCDNRCTYCAIPSIRGKYRSRPEAEIVAEARKLVKSGVKEIILVAQDTTSYGKDIGNGVSLSSLLQRLCEIDGLWRLRILYAYPERITDELIDLIASQEKIAKYLDIPLQHADPEVLRRMGRGGSASEYSALLKKIRERVGGITLRSTFIAGFPGETDEQFSELLRFIEEEKFERAGCFSYSDEDGVPSSKLKGKLSDKIKTERYDAFMRRQTAIFAADREARIGQELEVICDGVDEDTGMLVCRGEADAPDVDAVILLADTGIPSGTIINVRVTGTDGCDLYAERI